MPPLAQPRRRQRQGGAPRAIARNGRHLIRPQHAQDVLRKNVSVAPALASTKVRRWHPRPGVKAVAHERRSRPHVGISLVVRSKASRRKRHPQKSDHEASPQRAQNCPAIVAPFRSNPSGSTNRKCWSGTIGIPSQSNIPTRGDSRPTRLQPVRGPTPVHG